MKLLIVDDFPANLRLLRAQLEAEGHAVVEAADGVEALRLLAGEKIDGIISDALMPNMDGFSLCLEVRCSVQWAELPFVIYTSTYNSPADRKLALDAGADSYVAKPAPATELIEAIRQAGRRVATRPHPTPAPEVAGVMKQYNAVLVAKLEQKNTELERVNAELRASEARFHGTLESMLEGCQIIGFDWRYLYVNDTAAQHYRCQRRELIGRTLMECHPGIDQTEVFLVLWRCLKDRKSARVENEFTYQDGTKAWFELSIQPVPEGIFILSLDITDRKLATQKVRDQLDELIRWQEVMLGREERMLSLKAEVNELLAELNRPARYAPAPPP